MSKAAQKTKLERFHACGIDYDTELRINKDYLACALICFQELFNQKKETCYKSLNFGNNFEIEYFNHHRLKEIMSSVTDDICRYGMYHNIALNKDNEIAIAEPTRAAFFVKWVAMFRPCKLDEFSEKDPSGNENILAGRCFEYSNEILSIYLASVILGAENDDREKVSIICKLNEEEILSLFYQLKYRIKHQDSYYGLFNRLFYDK